MFYSKKINEKMLYCSDLLNIEHFFTTRQIPINENKIEIANYLKIDVDNLISPNQTHSTNVETVDLNKKEYQNCDALILDKKDIAIYLSFADCTPIILYDEKNKIGAIAHAGWRGTAGRIAVKTIEKMKERYNTNPFDVVAVIGPCISFTCFETYFEALEALKKSVKNSVGLFKGNYADLKGINERQLIEIGVNKIDICPYCTVLDNDKFFSYRKENKTPLRHNALIRL